jgi:hypothetical protein
MVSDIAFVRRGDTRSEYGPESNCQNGRACRDKVVVNLRLDWCHSERSPTFAESAKMGHPVRRVFVEKLQHMHINPVKRKLVVHPQDWPWSSFSFYAKRDSGLVHIDPMG